jgi:oligoendopeptidase F
MLKQIVFFLVLSTQLIALNRKEVPLEHCWNIEALYPSSDAWYQDLEAFKEEYQVPEFHTITKYRGALSSSIENIHCALKAYTACERRLQKLLCYAKLRVDEDLANCEEKHREGLCTTLMQEFMLKTNWLEHEILSQPYEYILLAKKCYKEHAFYLEKLLREKEHRLDPEKEAIIMLAGSVLEGPSRIFSTLNNADFTFDPVLDCRGQKLKLSHASYSEYTASSDCTLRKNSFMSCHRKYLEHENSFTELLQAHINSHLFDAKLHRFSSCLEAALYPKNIDTSVYHELLKQIHAKITSLHRYMALKKKLLHLDEFHYYDIKAPIVANYSKQYSFDEAISLILKALKPLGKDYVETLKKGLTIDRWVDRYENDNKRSGAYSSGCYDSMPYILTNFSKNIASVKTLAHEAGHSMHTYLSNQYQGYTTHQYDLFVAEVASTLNEELFFAYMIDNAKSTEEKASLITSRLDYTVGTLFRQACFAEFELFVHEMVENNIPLTPKLLKDTYLELIRFYFGSDIILDDEVAIEWARIPHFYSNFYVFQYVTGISCATCLHRRIKEEGQKAVRDYLEFLRSGGSDFPLNLLEKTKVDVRTGACVCTAIDIFDAYVTELEHLLL